MVPLGKSKQDKTDLKKHSKNVLRAMNALWRMPTILSVGNVHSTHIEHTYVSVCVCVCVCVHARAHLHG